MWEVGDLTLLFPLLFPPGTVDMQGYMSWLRGHGYVFVGDF